MEARRAYELLLDGFARAGFEVDLDRGGPFDLVVRDRKAERELRLELKLLRLRPGGHHPVEHSLRAWVPKRLTTESGARPLTIGYREEGDPFVGWPSHDLLGAPAGVDLWVSLSTIGAARERGFARPRRGSRAYAFLPDQVGRYLDAHGAAAPIKWFRDLPDGMLANYEESVEVSSASVAGSGEVSFGVWPSASQSVESGFVQADAPRSPIEKWERLEAGGAYRYWLSIGDEAGAWMLEPPSPLPDDLPDGAKIVVRLFSFDDELQLSGPLRGVLELQENGSVTVAEQAARIEGGLGGKRLFFDVRTPSIPGRHRLRCNLYYGSTLIQSRLVSALVGDAADDGEPALRTEVDYLLAHLFDTETLANIPTNDVSLMINGGMPSVGGASLHQFRVYAEGGEKPLEASSSFGEAQVAAAIDFSRNALRSASWSSEEEWDGKSEYLYAKAPASIRRLTTDLVRMARRGRELYDAVTGPIPTDGGLRERFRALTARPSRIEVTAPNEGTYLPAGLFYDHKIETAPGEGDEGRYRLCPDFLKSLGQTEPLEDCACFNSCPGADDRFLVCPSGFWGFRHEIGWPVPGGREPRPLSEIEVEGSARIAIGISTDPSFKLRDPHINKLAGMGVGTVAKSRDEFCEVAKSIKPHLVYFYCHGGIKKANQTSYIVLGEIGSAGIDTAYLRDEEIVWGTPPPRPLVFINGCHTSALSPSTITTLVSAFVGESQAAGVVGTEVTIFEPLACAFAEDVLEHFLGGSMTIGGAVRRARLDLLRDRNPLGLVYVPYVAAAMQIVKRGANSSNG
jgi:hypothetical protein